MLMLIIFLHVSFCECKGGGGGEQAGGEMLGDLNCPMSSAYNQGIFEYPA